MADTLLFCEDQTKRSIEVQQSVILYRRVYNVPPGATASLLPARGAAVDLDGVTGSGVQQPRVMSKPELPARFSMKTAVPITFYQIRLYSGQSYELNGSRQEQNDGHIRSAVRMFVTTDGSTGLPAKRDFYPGDSGLLGRRCVATPSKQEEVYPGLYYHVAMYRALTAY